MASVTTCGSLDDIVESEEDQLPSVSHEYNLTIGSSVDTVFEQDPKVPDSVVRITPSIFTWGSEDNTLVVDTLNFPRGELIKKQHFQTHKSVKTSINEVP